LFGLQHTFISSKIAYSLPRLQRRQLRSSLQDLGQSALLIPEEGPLESDSIPFQDGFLEIKWGSPLPNRLEPQRAYIDQASMRSAVRFGTFLSAPFKPGHHERPHHARLLIDDRIHCNNNSAVHDQSQEDGEPFRKNPRQWLDL
jgi:hypothetical protein